MRRYSPYENNFGCKYCKEVQLFSLLIMNPILYQQAVCLVVV